ncbi:hypothetical protein ACFPN2_19105 [Steroidobacter flavus]|uniref:Uncharacterized protein n=1 Tax=Steroidobacter flavus TaxID=1842136 RepID=A0ABV8SVS8_9GAMM
MRIRVARVDSTSSDQAVVSFVSAIGRARGQWMGTAPAVDSEYEVEFDIPGALVWGDRIDATESSVPAMIDQRGDTQVFGTLQNFDGRVAELRLGDDLILVEVDRVECRLPCNVAIKVQQLRLFDANV